MWSSTCENTFFICVACIFKLYSEYIASHEFSIREKKMREMKLNDFLALFRSTKVLVLIRLKPLEEKF